MARVRVEQDYGGIGELLKSAEVRAMISERGSAIARAAEARGITVDNDRVALPVTQVDGVGGTRAYTLVILDHPAGAAVEAKHRVLGGSLSAARG